jgi:hypothetical protein
VPVADVAHTATGYAVQYASTGGEYGDAGHTERCGDGAVHLLVVLNGSSSNNDDHVRNQKYALL